jgi:hypothetical protein
MSSSIPPATLSTASTPTTPTTPSQSKLIVHRLREHFGETALEDLQVFRRNFPIWMRIDVQEAVLSHFASRPEHQYMGCRLRGGDSSFCFPDLIEDGEHAAAVGPAVITPMELGEGNTGQSMRRGLWLDRESQSESESESDFAYGVLLERAISRWDSECRVEIAVPNTPHATRFARDLLRRVADAGKVAASLRGRVLTIADRGGDGMVDDRNIDFVSLPIEKVSREDIILDPKTFDLFERNTTGFIAQQEALAKLGFSTKKGILLYGPPGTGKTMLTRYLLSQLEGFTRVVISPNHLEHLAEAMVLLRAASPAVLVLEDVDLLAEDRKYMAPGDGNLLNTLLNEMDGLSSEAAVLFVLTTNRPEVLEPALAARPGRVDQAIEVGLPDHAERCRLLAHFAKSLNPEPELIEQVSKNAGKVSPAFLKELVRRAACEMLGEGAQRLSLQRFDRSVEDIVRAGAVDSGRRREKFGFQS